MNQQLQLPRTKAKTNSIQEHSPPIHAIHAIHAAGLPESQMWVIQCCTRQISRNRGKPNSIQEHSPPIHAIHADGLPESQMWVIKCCTRQISRNRGKPNSIQEHSPPIHAIPDDGLLQLPESQKWSSECPMYLSIPTENEEINQSRNRSLRVWALPLIGMV